MVRGRIGVFLVSVMLFSLISNVQANEESAQVAQFGTGFNEIVIADLTDGLDEPRDLEFHPNPARSDELWIVNRADDAMVIIHETGTSSQTSEERLDAYRNHFMEEVSAIAFGAYDDEFDYTFGTAQESRNTYNGVEDANNFMGPALWPSSLSHFAMENQNGPLGGSHIDMLHESPDGMGIAHDNGNAYWYFDGYYGHLVYYDFQADHDTGETDHSDGIVHRYSDVPLTRYPGVPSHMVLDKDSGILYISDTGANRVLWVNTDDQSTSSTDIYDEPSRMETLAQYLRIDGVEWGILDTGLNRPSGIALEGKNLFVSEYGNSEITAYDLDTNGRGGKIVDVIQTGAQAIMGIEIGPDGHLYYVDNGRDQVVRIDPYFDMDEDGAMDNEDNCPFIANVDQADYDEDNFGDACDDDDDNDSVLDDNDSCPTGQKGWASSQATDHDLDGCADASEDDDDDNDGLTDSDDNCPVGEKAWWSKAANDYDGDGCRDQSEDLDDDNDGICDAGSTDINCIISTMSTDLCQYSSLDFKSNSATDNDADGCEDATEDTDDDNDGYLDEIDDCPVDSGTSSHGLTGCLDTDYDGYPDSQDAFPLDTSQWADSDDDGFGDELLGTDGDYCPNVAGNSTKDRIGCLDSDGDGWSNPDDVWNMNFGGDAFPQDATQHFDSDQDGYGDNAEGNQPDACPSVYGTSTVDLFGCRDSDGDGWSDVADAFINDETQWSDQDSDGYGDEIGGNLPDACPTEFGNSTITRYG